MTGISDYYPSEICERIKELPERANASDQQKRLIAIVEDDDVGQKALHVVKVGLAAAATPAEANAFLDNLWTFLEDAAGLLDVSPRAVRDNQKSPKEFFTPKGIAGEFQVIKQHCESLIDHLELRRDVIFSDKLEPLIAALQEFIQSEHLNAPNNDAMPRLGRSAGAKNCQNETLHGLFMRAEARLGQRFPTFCLEIHRVLFDLETPVEMRTARGVSPPLASTLKTPME